MVQDRWKSIFEPDTFVQTFAYVAKDDCDTPGDGVLTGYGAAFGRLIFAAIQSGDGLGKVQADKITKTIQLATKRGAPFFFFMNTKGLRLDEGLDAFAGYGTILQAISQANNEIPTVCVIEGDCLGIAAVIASLCDFVIMMNGVSHVSLRTALDDQAYANAGISGACGKNGFASIICDEGDYVQRLHQLIDYLPDSTYSGTDNYDGCTDDVNRFCSFCDSLNAEAQYDIRNVISEIADDHSFVELSNNFAPAVVTAFARFGGTVMGIIANQSMVNDGVINDSVCRKMASMIHYCDRFSIPLLTLTNTVGLSDDFDEEKVDFASVAAFLASSFIQTEIPKLNIIVGKAYGSGGLLMNSRQTGADYVYAWNCARISVGKPETMALIYCKETITNASNPVQAREDALKQYKEQYCKPEVAAQKGYIDDIMIPGETRARIINFIQMMA